jgi:UDP-N-acetylmuramoyl-tripeptide--D-alanyl-D-alanine ligase
VISVRNTIDALGVLAQHHRRRFKNPVIAIGGSNGKTTTKEMTAHILSTQLRVLKTNQNFNNQIGVPLTLLQLSDDYDIAVIEIGTNEPGEIAKLSSIVEPTHGLITNIGKEHLEKLIDLDGVEMEETFLFGYLKKNGGKAFINFDDERLKEYYGLMDHKVSYGTSEDSDIKAVIEIDNDLRPQLKVMFDNHELSIKMQTHGYVSAYNALAALAIALDFNLSIERIISAMESYHNDISHEYARMGVITLKGIMIINDCYNANPDSMTAAINSLKQLKIKRNKIAVLGDMRELGESSAEEHKKILDLAAESSDKVFITGTEMHRAFEFSKNENVIYNDDKTMLSHNLLSIIGKGDTILVKGSRGMQMEKVINELLEFLKK